MAQKNKRRHITVVMMCEVIEGLFVFIDAKRRVFRERDGLLAEHAALIDQIAACKSLDEMASLKSKLFFLQDELDEKERQLAFRNKGDQQEHFCNAADYDDTWTITYNTDGTIKTALRSWWMCLSGGDEWPCCTVVLAKRWDQKIKSEAWAPGQCWYCPCCNAKYRPKFGMLVEMHIRGTPYWMLAEEAGEYKDIKHMRVEADTPHAKTPKELYDLIKDVHPVVGEVVRPAIQSEMLHGKDCYGVYKVTALPELQKNGMWQWENLITYASGR